MAELLLVAFGVAVVVRIVDGKLARRRGRLDNAYRRARYATGSGRGH